MEREVPMKLVRVCTCILPNSLPPNISHASLYSDTCGGQNRNKYIAATLVYIIQNSETITTIDHKFMESGQSQMEVDSIHPATETAKKSTAVYMPRDWHVVCIS